MKLRIIEDGFELPFEASVENGPTLAGTYRPAVPAEVKAYRQRIAAAKAPEESVRVQAEFLAAHVLSWDAEGKAGPVPPTADALTRIPEAYADAIEAHVTGYYFSPGAVATEKKIAVAARLRLLDPEWDRSCESCRAWLYRDDDETPAEFRGTVLTRANKPVPRPPYVPPPCFKCPKVPREMRDERQSAGEEVTPADAADPDDLARGVVEHYLECRAVGAFPRDPVVRRHARLIAPYYDAARDQPLRQLIALVAAAPGRR